METAVAFAFLVTLGAGLATAVGAGVGLFAKHTNRQFLAIALGFSAGVMIYVSFGEILPKASDYIHTSGTDIQGSLPLAAHGLLSGEDGVGPAEVGPDQPPSQPRPRPR